MTMLDIDIRGLGDSRSSFYRPGSGVQDLVTDDHATLNIETFEDKNQVFNCWEVL